MPRHARPVSALPAAARPVPPLPHPSWTRGGRQDPSRPIAPAEFWERLGL